MHIVYLSITIIAALANGYAAVLNFTRAESVKVVADRVQVSQDWMIPLGALLGAGAIGLLVGLAAPVIGEAAAIGLVLYYLGAVSAHLRSRDWGISGAVFFLALASCALAATFAGA